jgi:ABC-type Fe3+-siderophore transport system permease subunit
MSRSMMIVHYGLLVALCVLGDEYATSSGVAVNKIKII